VAAEPLDRLFVSSVSIAEISQPDLIIAAIAFHHDLTVVTRDESDYRRARVPVLNPWHDPRPTSAV